VKKKQISVKKKRKKGSFPWKSTSKYGCLVNMELTIHTTVQAQKRLHFITKCSLLAYVAGIIRRAV
jgi:hypothetical protein